MSNHGQGGRPRGTTRESLSKRQPPVGEAPSKKMVRVQGDMNPPEWFDKAAHTCWEVLKKVFTEREQWSFDNYLAVVAICQCFSDWLRLRNFLAENGDAYRVLASGAGSVARRLLTTKKYEDHEDEDALFLWRKYPQAQMFADADRRLRGWFVEFGLTEASRSRINVPVLPETPEQGLSRYGLN